MGNDRAALTARVKEANDIVDVVGGYVALRPAGPTFKGLCPFHDDSRPSFDVDPRRQRYRCWACGKFGDVIQFIQEHERVNFNEAMELLARRAGITLEKTADSARNRGRALMLDCVRWSAEQYRKCLLDDPEASAARRYLGERQLTGDTVNRFGLGFAPVSGSWLVQRAESAGISFDLLETVGLIAKRDNGAGYYDRFRDRVMFPIRDARGAAVGFGGRILPSSPLSARAPKYYNSSDTPLFTKSELLYGLDQARHASVAAGYLAVVEGYTDVMMAHQKGIVPVVATMGTALNARHVQQLRRFVSRVVLVFDADAGGNTGVDRALEIFVGQDVDLAIATLPEGLDPCDLLLREDGPKRFQEALARAVDALDFKLDRLLAEGATRGVEAKRQAVEAMLGIIALAPETTEQAGAVKRELVVGRIARRLALKEETVWARLRELRDKRQRGDEPEARKASAAPPAEERRQAPAAAHERELLEVLLAEPELVAAAAAEIRPEEVGHPGLRQLLELLYLRYAEGKPPDLDSIRADIENPRLAEVALKLQDVGRQKPNRADWLRGLADTFRRLRDRPRKQELQNQLHAAPDHAAALDLLRQLQNQSASGD